MISLKERELIIPNEQHAPFQSFFTSKNVVVTEKQLVPDFPSFIITIDVFNKLLLFMIVQK